jgi:hypothetical protein
MSMGFETLLADFVSQILAAIMDSLLAIVLGVLGVGA